MTTEYACACAVVSTIVALLLFPNQHNQINGCTIVLKAEQYLSDSDVDLHICIVYVCRCA